MVGKMEIDPPPKNNIKIYKKGVDKRERDVVIYLSREKRSGTEGEKNRMGMGFERSWKGSEEKKKKKGLDKPEGIW